MSKRNITAVYIRGLAFKASIGGRRHQVLLNLKKADERPTDLWLLKYFAVFGLGLITGAVVCWLWPIA